MARVLGEKRPVKGATRKATAKAAFPGPVKVEVVVTRASGDQERMKLGEVSNLIFAYEWRRRLTKVAAPRRAA